MTERDRTSSLRVLLAQLAPVPGDVDANARRVAEVVREHPSADIALFPELFLTGYAADTSAALARELDDPLIVGIRAAAAEAGTAVVVGLAARGENGALHNSALCVDRDGAVAGVHRKTHPFGDEEKRHFAAGDWLHVLELAGRQVGVLICFEIEFPEPARALARSGAELLVSIAANMAPYGHDHHVASVARALDNRLPHAYVNRVGHESGRRFVGGSQIVDAGGRVVASAGTHEEIVVRDVRMVDSQDRDTDYLGQLRPGLRVRRLGRPALA